MVSKQMKVIKLDEIHESGKTKWVNMGRSSLDPIFCPKDYPAIVPIKALRAHYHTPPMSPSVVAIIVCMG